MLNLIVLANVCRQIQIYKTWLLIMLCANREGKMLFKKFLDFVVWVCSALAFLSVLIMMLQIVGDVIGRYFFNSPIDGTMAIVSNWYMVAIIFLPLALVQRHRQHVVTTFFIDRLSSRMQTHMKAAGDAVMLLIFGAFGYFIMGKGLALL